MGANYYQDCACFVDEMNRMWVLGLPLLEIKRVYLAEDKKDRFEDSFLYRRGDDCVVGLSSRGEVIAFFAEDKTLS